MYTYVILTIHHVTPSNESIYFFISTSINMRKTSQEKITGILITCKNGKNSPTLNTSIMPRADLCSQN